jgi:peptidoglycan/xylan/chitin deacetylase (PgdA/CDA1 family)
VFDDWLEWQTDSSTICAELSKLSPLDLTVFENQIRDPKYKKLLEKCQTHLVKTLDEYWKKERISLPAPQHDFKMKTEIVEVDKVPRGKQIDQLVGSKQVLLTFDDGPHPEYTEKLLRVFKQVDAKALFFMLGSNVRHYPSIVKKIAADDHAVGSHTETHACIAQNKRCRNYNTYQVGNSRAELEITSGIQSLISVLGWTHPFFRFPYGESSPGLQNFLYEKGFFDFYWGIDSEDWKKRGLIDYYRSLVAKVDAHQGGNILFHDIHKRTLEVMPQFLKYLHKNGYTIVLVKAKPLSRF